MLVKRSRGGVRKAIAIACLLCAVCAVAYAAVTAADVRGKLQKKIEEKWTAKKLKVQVTPYRSSARTRKGQFKLIKVSADSAERKGKRIRIVGLPYQHRT